MPENSVSERQANIERIINYAKSIGVSKQQLAYILGTVEHETGGTFKPDSFEADYAGDNGDSYRRRQSYYPYYGRSYANLTHDYNYRWASQLVGYDLVKDPDALLKNPDWGVKILVNGILNGQFGDRLDKYINGSNTDYYNARASFNRHDKKTYQPIADKAKNWETQLNNRGYVPGNSNSNSSQPRRTGSHERGMLSGYGTGAVTNSTRGKAVETKQPTPKQPTKPVQTQSVKPAKDGLLSSQISEPIREPKQRTGILSGY